MIHSGNNKYQTFVKTSICTATATSQACFCLHITQIFYINFTKCNIEEKVSPIIYTITIIY